MRLSAPQVALTAALLAAGGCRKHEIDLDSRPCLDGRCIVGYACHPEIDTCVPAIEVGCSEPEAVCPWRTKVGDGCPSPGSFLPCADGVADCIGGCRTCRQDMVWGTCSDATCVVGEAWSCTGCDDDCRRQVQHARPICAAGSSCDYDGACLAGFVDADRDRTNGCECPDQGVGSEVCDGADNDCDGTVDEGFGLGGACGVGLCRGGSIECATEVATRCDTMPGGSRDQSHGEICDGVDNDCDGTADNGFPCRPDEVRSCDLGGGRGTGFARCDPLSCQWQPCESRWWDDAWSKRMQLDLDVRAITESLNDVPILVTLTPARIDYADALTDGTDLRFVAADGVTLLSHEIERWDATGVSSIWVRLPAVDPTAASSFVLMYYGNPAANALDLGASVWSDSFEAVWHLGEEEPGRGRTGIYRDATGRGHDGADLVGTAEAKRGWIARGQEFNGSDETVGVPSLPALTGAAVTVEAWIDGMAGSRAFVRPVTLSTPTTRAQSQVALIFDGATFDFANAQPNGCDLRFFDTRLRPVPHFVESWNPAGESLVWLRIPEAGTDELRLYYGGATTACASDPRAVFDFYADFLGTALDTTVWAAQSDDYSVGGGRLHVRRGGIGLANPLPFDLADGYVIELISRALAVGPSFGGTVPALGSSRFVANNNGSSDAVVLVMREAGSTMLRLWAGSGWNASYDLGAPVLAAVTATDQDLYTAIAVDAASLRVYVDDSEVYADTSLVWWKQLRYLSLGAYHGVASYDIPDIDYAIVRVRQWSTWPTLTLGERTAAGISSAGGFGLGVAGGFVRASVVDATLVAPLPTAGWAYVSMVWDEPTLRLFVNGAPLATTATTLRGLSAPRPLLLGDLAGLRGALDEVRVSTVARSPAWLALQQRSMTDALLTYGPPASVPPR